MYGKQFMCVCVIFFTRLPKIMLILGLYCFVTVNVCFVPTTAALSRIVTGVVPDTASKVCRDVTNKWLFIMWSAFL
jgi:hypothetical protein